MSTTLNTTCTSCGEKTFTVCDLGDLFKINEKANYQVILREKFLTVDECGNQQSSCRGIAMAFNDFVAFLDVSNFTASVVSNHVAHGYNLDFGPIAVYQDQANPGQWLLAQDTINQAQGLITEIIDANNYRIVSASGFYRIEHGLDPSLEYFLSAAIPGRIEAIVSTQLLANPLTTDTLQLYGINP